MSLVLFACSNVGRAYGSSGNSTAHSAERLYRNGRYGFQFVVPQGWTARETSFYFAHYSRVVLTVNNQRPDLEIRDWPTGKNTVEFNSRTTFEQMHPGEVYVAFGYSGGPWTDMMWTDTVGTRLHSLLATNHTPTYIVQGLAELGVSFFKRGHRWFVWATMKDPVSKQSRRKLISMLESFRFLQAPIGNASWAESLAWKALPEKIRLSGDRRMNWPVVGQGGERSGSTFFAPRSVSVTNHGSSYIVKFAWRGVGKWKYRVSAEGIVRPEQPMVVYPVGPPPWRLPSDLPGESKGKTHAYWLAPYVQASRAFGKTIVTWFSKHGRVERRAVGDDVDPRSGFMSIIGRTNIMVGINEDWQIAPHPFVSGPFGGYVTSTPDSRVFFDEYESNRGLVSLKIYIHGKPVNTIGPFIPYSAADEVAVNPDGSAALLVWANEFKTNARIIVLGTNGIVQFQKDYGRAVCSPDAAPDGAGVLLRPNTGGTNQDTFIWFTKKGKVRSINIRPNPECLGWIPRSKQSLYATSLGDKIEDFRLINWDTGRQIWKVPNPGTGEFLAIALTPKLIVLAMAVPYHSSLGKTGRQWKRMFYALSVRSGKLVARWPSQLPHWSLEGGRDHFLQLHSKLFYVTPEECTQLNLHDVFARRNGWR